MTYNKAIHFHSVSWSDDPTDENPSEIFFSDPDHARQFTDQISLKFPAVWMAERGNCEEFEDIWMVYWWSELLRDNQYEHGEPSGRGEGWISTFHRKDIPTTARNSRHSYTSILS